MTSQICQKCQSSFSAYLDGAVSGKQMQQIARHLDACNDCMREFSAIINPPHATILAVGASRRAPVEAEDGSVKFVSQITVTLSCDHRVVDGAIGAQLLAAFKTFIEKPVTALV